MAKKGQNSHAVIVLASGLSRRLGQPKQLLKKVGEPLIGYMTNLALLTQPNLIVVVVPQNPLAIVDPLITFARKMNTRNTLIKIIVNSFPEKGMAESLSLGIQALEAADVFINSVLIMGIDQVLLDSEHLTELLAGQCPVVASSYHHLDQNHSAVVSEDSIIGLPIVINYKLLRQWQWSLAGDKGLRRLIRALPANQLITVVNPKLSHDVDTPEQLAYAQQNNWIDH